MNIRNTPQLNNMNTNNPTPIPMTAPMTLDTLRDLSDALMLRQTQANQRESETLLDDVQAFMLKARQAGQYLDKPADRRACQSLINYWSGLLYEHKREVGELSLLQFDERLAPELSAEPCPYLGLHPFGAGSSAFYFGRDKLVQDMLNTLRTQRMVCIVGSSGSGKSSAALGGLLPALQANALADSSLKDSAAWSLVTLTPGASPLRALAVALGMDADSDADALAKRFTQAEAEPITPITPFTPMLLVVDQFEELFTLCSDGAQRAAFATTLAHIYECGHYLVLTVRVDFVEAALSLAPLTERLEAARINMRPLSGDELRAAIERPAERVGLKIEGRVVDDLISEIRNEPAGLPLLQFTLRKLWENRRRNRITWDIYQKVGSPHLALERSADQFYNSLSPQDKEAMRRILLKLIRPPDDTSATYEPMSLRLTRAQLFQDNVSKDRVSQMLRRLVDQERLLRETPGQTDGDTHIEVAHEALARNWPRLAEWLKDERVSVRQMQHHQRMRRALVSSLVVAAVLATLALWALWERGQANAFARIKQRVADSYAAVDVMAANPAQALRKAVEANLDAPVLFETEDALRQTVLGFGGRQIVMTHTHPVVSAVYVNAGRRVATASGSEIVIWDAATGSKIKTLLAAAELQSLAATADGGLFVSIDVSGTVAVWSAQTYAQMHAVQLADELLDSAQFLPPDNAEVVILSQMGHVYRWRYKDSTQQPMLIPLASKVYPPMAVAPNGVLAAKTDPAHVVLWNLNTATPTPSMTLTLAHSEATALAFSRDSQQIGIGRDDGAAEVWQVGQPQQTQPRKIREWSAHRLGITILAFSSDGKKLATVGGNFLTVWEIESGSQ